MPIELAQPNRSTDKRFEETMETLAKFLVASVHRIEQNFADVACHPDMIEAIILDEWTGNLSVRASRIRQIEDTQPL